ncbi:DUF4870 domain-containing protein [Myroides sp. 1354]|uniref:DUF4870 domain-containing protein n=1 Tax=unclassified Myroides TaxID=2642485 RepID=UPI0025777F91|nr:MULTISPECIES: DUF4870 domain-containing protein [unclassified Myroides]MDM1044685.1 DUF4870 domain-containing protein [Myroides sp. R163-1]MDM1055398.1 DUF4870 domain-containing protein [Myroides sp. 1354]MDM1068695.1 DUF4870 domain-containing protein [Myroides sp. 1372]
MDNKTRSIVSYITIIGWLIAYFAGKENTDDVLKYHLKQSLGLFIAGLLFSIICGILILILPAIIGLILSYISYAFWILAIFGIINAANHAKKPVPLIGKLFEDKFDFIR